MLEVNLKREFYDQLEGLRGIAILLVMFSHFLLLPYYPGLIFLDLGFWGVNIFFVLSGFLITEILFKDIRSNPSKGGVLKKFYIRRTLRIFPIYYLVLIVLYLVDYGDTRAVAPYTFTYTYNLAIVWGGVKSETISHLWSLCVEEQFYLVWPALLIFTGRKYHLKLIVVMISIGILSRLVYVGLQMHNYPDFKWTTPACFDCLGAGALLAWLKMNRLELLRKILAYWLVPVTSAALCWIISLEAGAFLDESIFFNIVGRTLTAITGFYLIGMGALGFKGVFGRITHIRWLKQTGKISYGLYVYHWILWVMLIGFLEKIVYDALPPTGIFRIVKYNIYFITVPTMMLISFITAWISFAFFEKPILRLKKKFEDNNFSRGLQSSST